MNRLQQLFETNAEAWKASSRPGALVSGISQIGKTTTIVEAAAEFERSWREVNSDSDVDDRIIADSVPVAWATCTSKTTIKTLCLDLLNYYGDPIPRGKPTESDLARKVKNCLYQCDTKVLVIDEVTRLKLHRENDQDVSDFIRDLMLSPATVVGMGVDIRKSAILGEGNNYIASTGRTGLATQTTHRFSLYELEPFNDATRDGLDDWRLVLADLQQQLLLLEAPDDLLISLSSYLYERSHGVMGWLINLVQGGCAEAIASGAETLTESLLDGITISVAADDADGAAVAAIVAASPERKRARKSGRNTIYDS